MRGRPAAPVVLAAAVAVLLALCSGCATRTPGEAHALHATTTPAAAGLDCARPTASATVRCLSASLTQFWSRTLARPVRLQVRVDPRPGQVPRDCRGALQHHSAFSCPSDDVVYLTAPFLDALRSTGSPSEYWVRLAATTGHEMGHIVQFAVHAPLLNVRSPSWTRSRAIEQQADCLAGVWSASVGIDPGRFRRATAVVLHVVDTAWERRSHGAPTQRLAALHRGQLGRSPHACGLTG